MAAPDYYVRGLNDAEARGPYNLEQLTSLAEAGQVTPETYFYDTATEQWLAIGGNAELGAALWPEKKKLTFKAKEFNAVNQQQSDSTPPLTVQEFLQAAEGKTADTADKRDRNLQMMQAAIWGTRGAAATLLASAVALALPGLDALMSLDPAQLVHKPLALLGVADAILGMLLLLGVISLYPLVRFRAVFGLGFLGFILWGQGGHTGLFALVAGSAGLYFSTIFLSYVPLAIAVCAGLGGMIFLASMSLF